MADKTFHSLTLPGTDPARVPDVAAEFNTGTSYAVRDYCTYQGILYRCTTAHTGAWNASHFQATNLDNEFDDKLKIPPFQASAPANPRVGDLWIDNDEDSPILSIDPAPIAGSTNAVQSGGVKTLIDAVDVQKASRYLLTGDYSTSATYEKGQLVFWYPETFSSGHSYVVGESCVHNGVVYKCTTAHTGAWNLAHFEAQHNASTDTLYRCITDIKVPESWTTTHWQATNINTEINRLRESEADTDMIAENYGDSSSYAVGDYVVHNSDLFRCISAVSDTGSWDPDDWEQIKLANDINDLNNAISDITGNFLIPFSNPTEKKYINTSISPISFTPNIATIANCKYAILECSEGDKFTITGTGGNGNRLWAFVDSGKNILERADPNVTKTELILTAPTNATHLIINDESDKKSYIGALVKTEVQRVVATENKITEYKSLVPYTSTFGILKTDGTISTIASSIINKYRNVGGKTLYINGVGGFDTGNNFCYVWFMKNGSMDSYIGVSSKPQTFDYYQIVVANDVDEIWINKSISIDLTEFTGIDQFAREKINKIMEPGVVGEQWYGKKWYAYGTSMTSVHEGTGKYPTYVQQFSGLILTEKGIGGGGICNNTRIKDAVMNITDGKLEADLITLEIGANDTTAPLGTIYDTGNDTFCGALNQCIRYLQANTSAQIVVISSTNARQNSGGASAAPEITYGSDNHTKYDQWKATRDVCAINSCYYIPMGESANMSWARMTANNIYNTDEIHHTNLGGYNLALFVWYQLRNIPAWYAVLPT